MVIKGEKTMNKNDKKISRYLINARDTRKWMKENNTIEPPSPISKDKEEKRLGRAFCSIRNKLLKPYENLKTEEEREVYKKRHPEYEEVKQIVDEIDRNHISKYLVYAKKIKNLMEQKDIITLLSTILKDEEKKALFNIKNKLLKPYRNLKTEEEKEKYKKKHPEYEEVREIIDEIDKKCLQYIHLVNVIKITEWMKEHNTINTPSPTSEDKVESKLGQALITIRIYLKKSYENLNTYEEIQEYKEVSRIVDKIDSNRNKKFEELVEEDIKKREILKQAKDLEASYEKQFKKKEGSKDIEDDYGEK